MNYYDISAGKICRCTGMHKYPKGKDEGGITFQKLLQHLDAKDLLTTTKGSKIGAVIEWWGEKDQRPPGFDLKVTAAKTTGFSPDADQLVAVKEFGGVAQPRDKEFDKRRRLAHIGAGFFTLDDELKIECSLDSDNLLLLKGLADLEEKDRKTGERQTTRGEGLGSEAPFPFQLRTKVENDRSLTTRLTVVLELQLYPQAKEAEGAATYYLRLCYTLVDLFPYEGFAAIDFGNSACSFAVKPLDSLDVESITLPYVDCENRDTPEDKRPPMLESAVYINRYLDAPDDEDTYFPPCEWVCGNLAMGKPEEMGLVVAPKRYLGKDADSQVFTQGRDISCHYPAELLLTSILREAHYQLRASVHSNVIRDQPVMTLTYPSSYSRHEIDRLERCYLAAVARSLPVENEAIPLDATSNPRMLDEASAAAFYFLYRDFFYSAGRVPAFEYIYPHGANVLILDFGGGTTDVALVRCVPERNEEHPSTIRMNVLRRTGMRSFGGDNITQAVYRVVKTEVARFLTQSGRGQRLGEPAKGQSFDHWYTANERLIDEAVPTKFVGLSEGEERTKRRKLTKAMWTWAEEIKRWLGETNEACPRPEGGNELDKFIREAMAGTGRSGRVRPGQDNTNVVVSDWLDKTLPKQIVERAHDIEQQVRPDLENLMRKVNYLLNSEFDGPDKDTDESLELHRVYVVGRAAHFELVRSIIADELALQVVNHQGRQNDPDWGSDNDRDVRRFVFDKSESKNAIAKGALLYAFLRTNRFENEFVADEKLRDRIPYDVLHSSTETKTTIFRADSDYEVMQREWTPMPELKDLKIEETDGERRVTLQRHWPGDDEGVDEPFFYFTLSNPVAGPLKIQYEEGATYSGYVLRDFGGHDERIPGTWIESKDTVPPMQRGEL